VLDRTAFYPRGGGQEPDHGKIGDAEVTDVVKFGDVVIHSVVGKVPRSGATVDCQVEGTRRRKITQIHTATHILNGSSRQVLGPWVWQHSAFKEEDYGRLDITHFAHLTQQEVEKIEDLANEVVRKNLPVNTSFMPRQEAEERYGFRIYQGGIVPTKSIRIVNIGNWDIEACGGTHAKRTGDVGLVKITKAERVQDGVERLEFVAGESAIEYVHRMDSALNRVSATLETQRENIAKVAESLKSELEAVRAREKALGQRMVELSTAEVLSSAKEVKGVKLYVGSQSPLGEELIIAQGQKCTESDPSLVYVNVFVIGNSARVVCFVGAKARESGLSAGEIARQVAGQLGGSGGGSAAFAQGGGPSLDRIEDAVQSVEGTVASLVRG
ncbi:MAG: alanine--tRNA ligase, partial [Thaumarchaeota archaeon]